MAMAAKPPTAMVYGPPKRGKTSDLLRCDPRGTFFTPAKGNLDPWSSMTLIRPTEVEVETLDDVISWLHGVQRGKNKRPTSVILDDTSVLAERTIIALTKKRQPELQDWGKLRRKILLLREICIVLGIPLLMSSHERMPWVTKTGDPQPGGPKMPTKEATPDFPYIATLVLRCGHDPFAIEPDWPGRYIVAPKDTRWITGDRYGVVSDKAPMNLREILVRAKERGCNVMVPARAPGTEWLDSAAEGVARGIARGMFSEAQACGVVATQFANKPPEHLRWAWQDGVARARLRAYNPFRFFVPHSAAASAGTVAGFNL